MSASIYLYLYSNGHLYFANDIEWWAGTTANASSETKVAEAGTLVKIWKINPGANAQLITTLTGSGNSSASALAATNGATTKGALVEVT